MVAATWGAGGSTSLLASVKEITCDGNDSESPYILFHAHRSWLIFVSKGEIDGFNVEFLELVLELLLMLLLNKSVFGSRVDFVLLPTVDRVSF